MSSVHCPSNSFRYNATKCACNPGFLFNATTRSCLLFTQPESVVAHAGAESSLNFPATIFSFDSIKRFTQSQAVFLEATVFMLVSWLAFCFFLRLGKLRDGRAVWFRIRWWISRLDVCFSTCHWLDDEKVVTKRKTELGGAFSVASLILFVGLFAALLYHIISKRTIEVHNIRATNAPDLASFLNDLEISITTISGMSCSNIRGLGTFVTGNSGFDLRTVPLSNFFNFSCLNTTMGPNIFLRCSNCRLVRDNAYISWQFVDLPNNPATAVGFDFNLTAKNHANRRHWSSVSGTLKNGSYHGKRPISYRGLNTNILKFNLFPRIYHNMDDLKLIQPIFHEFLPGSFFDETTQFQASLESSINGLINTTLLVHFLSAYIVEVDNQSIMGPVSFLADLGGLYCTSIGIFFYILVQCEYRIKKLRHEDNMMRKIKRRSKAQDHWDKLRRYVKYTWDCTLLDDHYNNEKKDACLSVGLFHSSQRHGSLHKRRLESQSDMISFNNKVNLASEKVLGNEIVKQRADERVIHLCEENNSQDQSFPSCNSSLSPLPLEFNTDCEMSMSDIQKHLKTLYDYNAILRDKLVATEAMLHDSIKK